MSSVAFVTALTAVVAGSGLPLHGHLPDHDHDAPHVEHPHHAHDASYAQGDDRRTTQAPKLTTVVLVGSLKRLPDLATMVNRVPREIASPTGRHPPSWLARAPPA